MIVMIGILVTFVLSCVFSAIFKDALFGETDWAELVLIWCAAAAMFGMIGLFINLLTAIV